MSKTDFRYRNILYVLVLLISVRGPAGVHADGAEGPFFTKHFGGSLFAVSSKKLYSVEILPDDREYPIGKNLIGLVIHNSRDEDVGSARIAVSVEDQGGSAPALDATVRDKGDGLYTVTNLDLRRQGSWRLRIIVDRKGEVDEAVFSFPEAAKEIKPAGKYN